MRCKNNGCQGMLSLDNLAICVAECALPLDKKSYASFKSNFMRLLGLDLPMAFFSADFLIR